MDNDVTGFAQQSTYAGPYNAEQFRIIAELAKLATATPVQVKAVHGNGVDPVGFVDVLPLVGQRGADGTITPHGLITNLPYNRLQGGANAVIIDPQVDDIGMAVFASRDISAVKAARAAAPPGSERMYSYGDGMYLGGILNGTPTQYILFDQSGITVVSPQAVTVKAPTVSVIATVSASITAPMIKLGAAAQSLLSFITSAFEAKYNGHVHPVTAVGSNTQPPTVPMNASDMTSTVTGG